MGVRFSLVGPYQMTNEKREAIIAEITTMRAQITECYSTRYFMNPKSSSM